MKFAKSVFWVAGAWGLLVLSPSYFLYELIGHSFPPPVTHPEFFYGFVGVAMVWQFAFFVIASAPVRFRPMMIPAVLEKFGYGLTLVVLYLQGRIGPIEALPAVPDGLLGILFTIAFLRVKREEATLDGRPEQERTRTT